MIGPKTLHFKVQTGVKARERRLTPSTVFTVKLPHKPPAWTSCNPTPWPIRGPRANQFLNLLSDPLLRLWNYNIIGSENMFFIFRKPTLLTTIWTPLDGKNT